MKPFKLKDQLGKVHLELANKDLAYFKIKNTNSNMDHGAGVPFRQSNVVEASYKISLLIERQKPHRIEDVLLNLGLKRVLVLSSVRTVSESLIR